MESRYVQERENNVIDIGSAREARALRLARGGNGPPKGTGDCWIAHLEEGTRFLAREKARYGSEVEDFVIASNPSDVVVFLAKSIKGRDGLFEWHDPKIFCQNYELYRTLEIVEANHGNDQSIQPGSVECDANAEEQHTLHDRE